MPERVVVYGASGHGKVVADIVTARGDVLLGFVDDDETMASRVVGGVPVLGSGEWAVAHRETVRVALGIGANRARRRVGERLLASGVTLHSAIHPRATVAGSARVGDGTVIMAGAVVNADAILGSGVIVNSNATIEHDNVIGDWAHVSPGAALGGNVVLGEESHVGLGAVVLPGVRVGRFCTVGAAAAVARDVADGVVTMGVPARPRVS